MCQRNRGLLYCRIPPMGQFSLGPPPPRVRPCRSPHPAWGGWLLPHISPPPSLQSATGALNEMGQQKTSRGSRSLLGIGGCFVRVTEALKTRWFPTVQHKVPQLGLHSCRFCRTWLFPGQSSAPRELYLRHTDCDA